MAKAHHMPTFAAQSTRWVCRVKTGFAG